MARRTSRLTEARAEQMVRAQRVSTEVSRLNGLGHEHTIVPERNPTRSRAPDIQDKRTVAAQGEAEGFPAMVAAALAQHQVGEATGMAMDLLARRVREGDEAAEGLIAVLDYYAGLVSRLPPLYDAERIPLQIDDRLAICFEQVMALLREQDMQVAELSAILAELL